MKTEFDIYESPNKYGRFDDDIDELVAGFNGGDPLRRSANPSGTQPSGEIKVDEDFLRKAGNPDNHYGR